MRTGATLCRASGPQENPGGLHRISQNQAKEFSPSYRRRRPSSIPGSGGQDSRCGLKGALHGSTTAEALRPASTQQLFPKGQGTGWRLSWADFLGMPRPPVATCTVPLPFTGSLPKMLIVRYPRKDPRQGKREGFIITTWGSSIIHSFIYSTKMACFPPSSAEGTGSLS